MKYKIRNTQCEIWNTANVPREIIQLWPLVPIKWIDVQEIWNGIIDRKGRCLTWDGLADRVVIGRHAAHMVVTILEIVIKTVINGISVLKVSQLKLWKFTWKHISFLIWYLVTSWGFFWYHDCPNLHYCSFLWEGVSSYILVLFDSTNIPLSGGTAFFMDAGGSTVGCAD